MGLLPAGIRCHLFVRKLYPIRFCPPPHSGQRRPLIRGLQKDGRYGEVQLLFARLAASSSACWICRPPSSPLSKLYKHFWVRHRLDSWHVRTCQSDRQGERPASLCPPTSRPRILCSDGGFICKPFDPYRLSTPISPTANDGLGFFGKLDPQPNPLLAFCPQHWMPAYVPWIS